jgi:hypothetical protein
LDYSDNSDNVLQNASGLHGFFSSFLFISSAIARISWLRVGQAKKGQGFFLPVGCKTFGIFGADHYNGNVARYKLVIVLAQLRHMLLAEWPDKGAVENQQHVFLAAQISQAEDLA